MLEGRPVATMQGRFHFYEGYSLQQVTFPIRVMQRLGVDTLIVSNACGGMNPIYRRGDLMRIADHINLIGDNPLRGPNLDELGPRFPDMSEPYDRGLGELADRLALEAGIRLHLGVYVAVAGPNLETRAEYRFLRMIGADVVGMSTVPEVIAARHGGMRVLGLSIVTDECFPDALEPVDITEIIRVAGDAEPQLTELIRATVRHLDEAIAPDPDLVRTDA
jgi:purine-nucleoside phosphorylase